jgi:hypothetical protein
MKIVYFRCSFADIYILSTAPSVQSAAEQWTNEKCTLQNFRDVVMTL